MQLTKDGQEMGKSVSKPTSEAPLAATHGSVVTDTDRINWLCRCTAGEWAELQNIRLAHRAGYLRNAVDSMMNPPNGEFRRTDPPLKL